MKNLNTTFKVIGSVPSSEIYRCYADNGDTLFIGYIQGRFGSNNEFLTEWWSFSQRKDSEIFRENLVDTVQELRRIDILKSFAHMNNFCNRNLDLKVFGQMEYLLKISRKDFVYYLKMLPYRSVTNSFYIYCYRKR